MTKQLFDLYPNLSDMSEDELRSKITDIRNNKYVDKPALQRRVKKKSKSVKEKLLQTMSKEDLRKLLESE